jgi:SPX domain protein involved in polyphosphate accumulation
MKQLKFSKLFEYQKVPEWYDNYLNYDVLNQLIKNHKKEVKQESKAKLDGIWFMGGNCQVVQVPVVSHLPEDMDPARD